MHVLERPVLTFSNGKKFHCKIQSVAERFISFNSEICSGCLLT